MAVDREVARRGLVLGAACLLAGAAAWLVFAPAPGARALAVDDRARAGVPEPAPIRSPVGTAPAPEPPDAPPMQRQTLVAAPDPGPDGVHPRVRAWIADLRDDDVRWNANEAWDHLVVRLDRARPALEDALDSPDAQQRHLAAMLLWQHDRPPSHRTLEVTWEMVAGGARTLQNQRAHAGAVRMLYRHAAAARDIVTPGLWERNDTRRFTAACILGEAGDTRHVGEACAILIERLEDNHRGGDALMACHALYSLGPPALPHVLRARRYASGQARDLLKLVALDLRDPPRTVEEFRARARMHDVSCLYYDPAIQFDPFRSRIAR